MMKARLTLLAAVLVVCGLMVVSANAKMSVSTAGVSWDSQASSMNCGGCKAESGDKGECTKDKDSECTKDKEAQKGECSKDKQAGCPSKGSAAAE